MIFRTFFQDIKVFFFFFIFFISIFMFTIIALFLLTFFLLPRIFYFNFIFLIFIYYIFYFKVYNVFLKVLHHFFPTSPHFTFEIFFTRCNTIFFLNISQSFNVLNFFNNVYVCSLMTMFFFYRFPKYCIEILFSSYFYLHTLRRSFS